MAHLKANTVNTYSFQLIRTRLDVFPEEVLTEEYCDTLEKVGSLIRSARTIWTGLGKSGYVAALLAATAATTGLAANYIHAEDLLHGEINTLRDNEVLVAISWSAKSEQIVEILANRFFTTVMITSALPGSTTPADYTIRCQPVSDVLLSGIPAESALETLAVGYRLIA